MAQNLLDGKYTEYRFLLRRILQPKNWSLRTRLVYTTGAILLAGAILTLAAISFSLKKSATQAIHHKLNDFEHLVTQQSEQLLNQSTVFVAQLSATPEIIKALKEKDSVTIQQITLNLASTIRKTTGSYPFQTQFYTADSLPMLNSWQGVSSTVDKNTASLLERVKEQHHPAGGPVIINNSIVFNVAMPLFSEDQFVGSVVVTYPFENFYSLLNLKSGYGISVLLAEQNSEKLTSVEQITPYNGFFEILSMGTTHIDAFQELSSNSPFSTTGSLYTKQITLNDFADDYLGVLLLFYDASAILNQSKSTIFVISLMAFFGVLFLFLSLFWNVNRIRSFFKQMKKVLISSHSNDFNELFNIDNVHCLDVLKCGHKECPMHKDPTRVCYLETGDEAISPKYRNTCIFLNKYEHCKNCPVYRLRHGDEIMEMKHMVNTMMRLWGDFLGSVGKLLSEVFRAESGHMPSLDDVDGYLSQLAGLTNYSHDLQGVYDKKEVYQMLEWVFEKQFGLTNFNLLEVNASENRMEDVLERSDLSASHMEVFFQCELCRCMRVAEDVSSFINPHLCPFFGIEHTKQVRCCLPMVMGGRVGAVFTFVVDKAEWEYKQKAIAIMKKYLDETAPILSSLRLLKISKEQALKDPLTQCHNRRFMDEYLAQFERVNHRNPQKIGFIMADMDHFKMVNDEFGHLAGDEILKQMAATIRQNIRKSDLLIRYGGEEFLVILMEIKQDGITYDIAEKIRLAVEETKFVLPSGGAINKTLSMGVAEFPLDGQQLYQVIKYADVALYRAKDSGRNKVLSFVKEMWDGDDY